LNSHSHVICEKPFIVSDKKIKKILHLSKKNKKLIFENFMYVYHPVFTKLKKLIKHPNFGKIRYVISNFKLPSKNANDQRYQKNKGDGFYYDTAVYPISLENYLFNNYQKEKYEFCSEKIKNKVDLKGFIFINSTSFKRFYFWGEGQNYSNNIEIVFENSSIFVNKIYTKSDKENILIKIFFKNKIKTIDIKNINQFEIMFKKIQLNYYDESFQEFHRKKIINQIKLVKKFAQ
jgi:predicted dehydrogenase